MASSSEPAFVPFVVFSLSQMYFMELSRRCTGMILVYAISPYHSSFAIFHVSLAILSISSTRSDPAMPEAFAT